MDNRFILTRSSESFYSWQAVFLSFHSQIQFDIFHMQHGAMENMGLEK